MLKKITPFIFLFLPVSANACAVCFGSTDGNWRAGFTWGVIILGLLPFIMVTGFIFTIIRSSRRHRRPL